MPAKPKVLSVVTGDNCDLMLEVAKLWLRDEDRVLDLTYGLGNWWKLYKPPNFTGYRGNFTRLPRKHYQQYDVVMYDPPYVSIGGRSTNGAPGKEMMKRYGMGLTGMTPKRNADLIYRGFVSGWRALDDESDKRLLMVKCGDYISSGKFVQSHKEVLDMAYRLGMEQIDEFVHYSGTGPQPGNNLDGSERRQVHTRRAHTFLCIFRNG